MKNIETLYIDTENISVHRSSEHLVLEKDNKKIASVPIVETKSIILLKSSLVTAPALELVYSKGIDLIYIDRNGKVLGRMNSSKGGGAELRLAQYRFYDNQVERIGIAKAFVFGKINNQKELIKKYKRYYSIKEFNSVIKKMDGFIEKAEKAADIDELLGYEGISARFYWDCYKDLLATDVFKKRDYRPAPDYVNSALNLGYSFLENEITACLTAAKLDLEIGFLHKALRDRNSLTYDLMEEFRTPYIDSWLLSLFNRKMLKKEDFEGKGKGFYFTKEGMKKFVDLYRKHRDEGWYSIFLNQSSELKETLKNGKEYESFKWK